MNRMKILDNQDSKQLYDLIAALLQTLSGIELDGFTAARHFMTTWGIYADHHLYTEVMDSMTRHGKARCTQGWGTTKYIIL